MPTDFRIADVRHVVGPWQGLQKFSSNRIVLHQLDDIAAHHRSRSRIRKEHRQLMKLTRPGFPRIEEFGRIIEGADQTTGERKHNILTDRMIALLHLR